MAILRAADANFSNATEPVIPSKSSCGHQALREAASICTSICSIWTSGRRAEAWLVVARAPEVLVEDMLFGLVFCGGRLRPRDHGNDNVNANESFLSLARAARSCDDSATLSTGVRRVHASC
jgi:hypothetical protein